ncbi:ABC transporter substrate-binding protein [Deinococcus petrolearius]|uniref:ABC transporter substrate-binding protein n=1 Tax=Deinococcus petrolearius TaxID=1751295 RepID=A0ABW1DNH7_9DEIO
MRTRNTILPTLTLAILTAPALATAPKDTLVLMQSSDITTLDPAQAYDVASFGIVENLYETLVTYRGSDQTKLQPLLATGWTIRPDGRQYTFDLRRNVRFHSGNVMTCADAEYSLRRLLVTNNADSGNFFIAQALLGTESNAKDDPSVTWPKISRAVACNAAGQLVLTLPSPDPALLAKLASQNTGIVDRAFAVKLGEWDGTGNTWERWVGEDLTDSALSRQPSGTGAYQLVRQDAQTVLATRHDQYWGGAAPLKNVAVQMVSEEATRLASLQRCDADVAEVGLRATLPQLRSQAALQVLDHLPDLGTPVMLMNQNIQDPVLLGSGKLDGKGIPANFFSDLNIRQAFSFAFDSERYIREITSGAARHRTMALPPTFLGYDRRVPRYAYSRARATEAFKKAFGGQVWTAGFVLNVNYRSGSKTGQATMELLKASVEALNPKFRVNIQPQPWSELLAASKSGKASMLTLSWSADYADPDNVLYALFSSEGFYAPRTGFKDAQVDAWLEQARTLTDPQQRAALYRKVGARTHDLATYILMPAEPSFLVFCKGLKGVSVTSYNPMLSGLTGTYWRQVRK